MSRIPPRKERFKCTLNLGQGEPVYAAVVDRIDQIELWLTAIRPLILPEHMTVASLTVMHRDIEGYENLLVTRKLSQLNA